jgi:hypothetical protein
VRRSRASKPPNRRRLGPVEAITFLVNPEIKRYVDWALPRQAQHIARASGGAGTNTAYLQDLVSILTAVGTHNAELDSILQLVREVCAGPLRSPPISDQWSAPACPSPTCPTVWMSVCAGSTIVQAVMIEQVRAALEHAI